jgi:hypothetical protein
MEVEIPGRVPFDQLRDALRALGDHDNIDISLTPSAEA